jgi:hypothetical protein
MTSDRLARRLVATAGAAAIITMVGLSAACTREEAKAPKETVTVTVTVSATEKAPRIPSGPNPFTPPVTPAPQNPPTHVPGEPGGH